MPIIFTPAEDQTRDPLHANPNLYRAAIKAGLYHKAVQVCYIPNTIYSGILRGYLPPSVVGSFQFCLVTVMSFRNGAPVYNLTFVDVKRRAFERWSSDLIKRIASRLWHTQIANCLYLKTFLYFFSFFDVPKKIVIQRIWWFVYLFTLVRRVVLQSGCVSKLSRLKGNWTCALTCLLVQMHVKSHFVIAFGAFIDIITL